MSYTYERSCAMARRLLLILAFSLPYSDGVYEARGSGLTTSKIVASSFGDESVNNRARRGCPDPCGRIRCRRVASYPAFQAPHAMLSSKRSSRDRHSRLWARMDHTRSTLRKVCSSSINRRLGARLSMEAGGGWSGRPRTRRPLALIAERVNAAVVEMCVENKGRPLAMAITDLVERAIEAFASGE